LMDKKLMTIGTCDDAIIIFLFQTIRVFLSHRSRPRYTVRL
jgi:hypothetical protein